MITIENKTFENGELTLDIMESIYDTYTHHEEKPSKRYKEVWGIVDGKLALKSTTDAVITPKTETPTKIEWPE